jgi:hypothetical protein
MASNDSKLELFDPQSQNIITWMERFEMLMEIREIELKFQKGHLLTSLSVPVYNTIKDLLAPALISEAAFDRDALRACSIRY